MYMTVVDAIPGYYYGQHFWGTVIEKEKMQNSKTFCPANKERAFSLKVISFKSQIFIKKILYLQT